MSARRFALLVATGRYDDPALGRLRSPVRDADGLAEVLRDPGIGDFEVSTVVDRRHHEVTRAIEDFFLDRGRDDLLLLHLSCHGVKNDDGELYFAATDTDRRLLASTAVSAEFLRTRMSRCRARSIVVLLDCCYSGAFLPGIRGDDHVHLKDELAGHGRVVITATNRTEYAWEGERLDALDPEPSRFTGAVIKGLASGEADRDGDGLISAHDLYDYVYDELRAARVRQRPQIWADMERQVVIARSVAPVPRPAVPAVPAIPPQADGEPQPAVPDPPRRTPEPPPARPDPDPPSPPSALARMPALVEELCRLSCMEDAPSRMKFAQVLSHHLGRVVDLRGVRQRDDVVVLARAALSSDGGEEVLLWTIEVFEGVTAADQVREGSHAPARNGGHAGAAQLLLDLVEAMCRLLSVQDPQDRMLLASLLGDLLGRRVDIRGVRLREDVVALVWAALGVRDGERLLVDVVRLAEGEHAAAELEQAIQPIR